MLRQSPDRREPLTSRRSAQRRPLVDRRMAIRCIGEAPAPWAGAPALRVEVLVGNAAGRAFWKSAGFEEYCVTMEARGAH